MTLALKKNTPLPLPHSSPATHRMRILMVDDDPGYRALCRRYLASSRQTEFEVVTAASGAEALQEIEQSEFDCVLVDYVLPDLTGTQVIRDIRDLHADDMPPTVVLTAQGGEHAAADAVRAGAMDFLPKRVVSSGSLVSAIENAVQKSALRKSIVAQTNKLKLANEQLKARNEEISRFYQVVSHEVKTPLAAAREFIAITLDGIAGPVTDYQKEMLTHALESCDQISAHFNDLIEVTRLESRKIVLNRELSSIDDVVTRCFAAMSQARDEKKIFFKKRVLNQIPDFWFDVNRIIQVLTNLLGNAIKYSPSHSTVTLILCYDEIGRCVELSVSDEGPGISAEDQKRIFNRLYQVGGKGDDYMGAGLGLGLSIAQEIVELHNGSLSVDSRKGHGSTFTLRLPSGLRHEHKDV